MWTAPALVSRTAFAYLALGIRLFGYLQCAFFAHCIIYLLAFPIFFENMGILNILELEKENKKIFFIIKERKTLTQPDGTAIEGEQEVVYDLK